MQMTQNTKYTWETIPVKDVPKSIAAYLDKHFSQDIVFGMVKEKDKENTTVYLFDVEHFGMMHHLQFDSAGNFVSEKIEVIPESSDTVGNGD
jgi:hypothetical protein